MVYTERFRFKKMILPIDIEGMRFDIEMTAKFGAKLRYLAQKSLREADAIEKIKDPGTRNARTVSFLSGVIDAILGDGAIERIFSDRTPDLFDLSDMLLYICDTYNEYQQRRIAGYAARRAECMEKEGSWIKN